MPSWIAIWPLAVSTSAEGMKNGETRSAPRSRKTLLLLGDRRDAADRRADEDADARRVELLDARFVPGLLRGGDGEQDVAVHPPRLLRRRDSAEGSKPRTSPAIRTGNSLASKRLDEPDPAAARDGRLPGRAGIEADRGDGSEAGDGDATHEAKSVVRCAGHGRRTRTPRRARSARPVSADGGGARPRAAARATAGRTSRSGTDFAACSRTSAASCGCGRATAGRCCATSRSSARSASCCHRAPRSTARS